ncbi:Hsp70 family protein [Paraburkholderia dioscoreae]|uniref:Molecular chaperone DnaK n=1 Tax=Paraburkholderia dioscoreae TaxID=2604047 RepID=A0A5Q4ZDB3_9BURK|nr:Hsp70 family protein [Paraburkholderia dioscoreae]VVD29217.1 Molecular chaperone DnaK [Paraburkholderia dioscoreae]
MKHYVGIDLGTTNSAITTYDAENVRLYKSPEQNDVTPSAIFVDKRGNRYFGQRAYENAARSPDNAAKLFKRLMGTSTPINLSAVGLVMTPEECSAEILRVLFGYLPEEIRNDPDTGTVITVPAAFNQMQKDATMAAAESAGLGKVALMQEPVAAVMSVMRQRKSDGIFLVFDLGGGTLDIAIAESINGRVSLLAHGGVAMCGGRDFDRALMDNIVKPWLMENFDLPDNFSVDKQYSALRHMAEWATERAKIELSARDESIISLDDSELRVRDRSGADIYLDIPVTRAEYDALIADKLEEAIQAARDTLDKAGLTAHDVGRVVFVGGPTQYKPLRDKVAFELGIAASTDVNPMTAVSEGAAVFAESIDWTSHSRGRKSGRGELSSGGGLNLTFNYVARTPDTKARIVAKAAGQVVAGAAFQIDSLDTGWSSGRVELRDGANVEVPLTKPGENVFKVFIFDGAGGHITLPQDKLIISRTAAQIDAIPASHSIGVEAREKLGGRMIMAYIVREGDPLPKKGKITFRADESLRAGAPGSIKFKLFEGSIDEPPTDNRFIGLFEIRGSDFSEGVIVKGAELLVDYEAHDSGAIVLDVTVPSIGANFNSGRNFYSRQDGQIDYSNAAKLIEDDAENLESRIDAIAKKVNDPQLDRARAKLRSAKTDAAKGDPESAKQAMDDVQEAKKLLALTRRANLRDIRTVDLESCVSMFDEIVRRHARPAEETAFDNLAATARRAIASPSGDFESHLREMRGKNWDILARQDWFVIDRFKWLAGAPHLFHNAKEHEQLALTGLAALEKNDIDQLRNVVDHLDSIRISLGGDDQMLAGSNILVG